MASDTKVDPWALLREAQWAVAYVAAGPNALRDAKEMRDRIDSALAAHEAEERTFVWTANVWQEQERLGFVVTRRTWDGTNGKSHATIRLLHTGIYALDGVPMTYFATLDEAKSAAIAAARGMR